MEAKCLTFDLNILVLHTSMEFEPTEVQQLAAELGISVLPVNPEPICWTSDSEKQGKF